MQPDLLTELFSLCNAAAHWALDNVFPLAVGAVLGSGIIRAGLGLVSDAFRRGSSAVKSVINKFTGSAS